jgi:hypothetical protein
VTATVTKPTCAGKLATIVGSEGNNTIIGTQSADVICADRTRRRRGRTGPGSIQVSAGCATLISIEKRDRLARFDDRLVGGPATRT